MALLYSCKSPATDAAGRPIADSNIEKGRLLAVSYCGSCHLLPEPSLLNKKSWESGVLPAMRPRLLLSKLQWQLITDYYTGYAPDTLPGQRRAVAIRTTGLDLFSVETPAASHSTPVTAFVTIDTSRAKRQVLVGTMLPSALLQYDDSLRLLDSLPLGMKGGIVDLDIGKEHMVACDIGIINPNNGKLGSVFAIDTTSSGKMRKSDTLLFDKLARPVQIIPVDINNDGRLDYLVCEFGNLQGALSWMENSGGGNYVRHVLRAAPGAIRAYVRDYNNDGLPDIWVLFAQGDEGIFLFTNKGNGVFEEQEVLRFPPVYGSSYFEMADMNRDGYPDILYTCGDNADFSQVLKPYHGVYIFLNDGKNHFTQAYFFPINGCYKAMARDFDGDGDLDIATISFFADYAHQPEEGFVYLENKGDFQFQPYSLPATQRGRWITMNAADLDGDGREDILLGNFSVGPTLFKSAYNWKEGPLFLLLRNRSARR